jgi:1-deoxy-D-xylulose-5-phosphate reductoisomerase
LPPERTRVCVLGSTGSIGRQALDVLASHPDRFEIVSLAAGRDAAGLARQVEQYRPRVHALSSQATDGALLELATGEDVDMVLVATGGIVSLRPVIAALEAGKRVATANKETLVAGGHLVMALARKLADANGDASPLAWLRPIDSEHSAIWQCLAGENMKSVRRLILTASGGPFRTWPADRLENATAADALAHPTWRMGAKITIDSATLVNKALEVIEARWLYDVGDDRIDVVVHAQSIVHSFVEFEDGSLKAQLGLPDMRIPIQYALTFPDRLPSPAPDVEIDRLPALTFEPVDNERFPALRIGREAGHTGSRASAALIAADEVAARRFLDGSLSFTGIAGLCGRAVERFGDGNQTPSVDELVALDQEVQGWALAA